MSRLLAQAAHGRQLLLEHQELRRCGVAVTDPRCHDRERELGLDGLAEARLIDRAQDPSDRRARLVTLTDAGRERLAAARADVRAVERELLAGVSQDDVARLRAALRRVGG